MNNKNRLNYALSNDDISEYFPDVKITGYDKVKSFHDVNHLLQPFDKVVLLYRTEAREENSGHWCCIFRSPVDDSINYFDSYGDMLDNKALEYENDLSFQKLYGQDRRYLTKLLAKQNDTVRYNHYKLQKYSDNISTCGRWCLLRLLNTHMNEDEFYETLMQMKREGKYKSLDNMVTNLIRL